MAGTALGAHGATSAWQAQHFDSVRLVGARLVAVGLRMLLRGSRSNWCTWSYFCVAGADFLGIQGARLVAAGLRLLVRGTQSTCCGATLAWQAQHFDSVRLVGALGRRSAAAAIIAWPAQHLVHMELLLRGR